MTTPPSRRQFLRLGALLGGLVAVPLRPRAAETPAAARAAFRFGFALNAATIRGYKLDLPAQIDLALEAGYEGIEPWTRDVADCAGAGHSLKDLGQRCRDRGLKVVSAIGFAPWLVDDDRQRAAGVEQMKREMDHLALLGGTHIAAPPAGVNRAGVKLDLDRAAERYRVILEAGRGIGVIPQIETWGSSANLSHLAEALYVAARTGDPDACILADVFHMYKSGTAPSVLKLIGGRALHCFHMNDYPATPDRATINDGQRVWPGDGIAPLKEILSHLAAAGAHVMLSVELFNSEYWKLPPLECARTGLAKMKASVAAAGLA